MDSVDDNEAYGHIASRYHSLNDMVNHMDGVMWALAKMKIQWKEDLFFTVKLAR